RGERNPCVVNVALAMERNDRPGEIPPDRFGKNVDAGLGLRNGYPWFQPSEDVKRVPPLIFEAVPAGRDLLFHRERNPNIGSLAHCGAKEFGSRLALPSTLPCIPANSTLIMALVSEKT